MEDNASLRNLRDDANSAVVDHLKILRQHSHIQEDTLLALAEHIVRLTDGTRKTQRTLRKLEKFRKDSTKRITELENELRVLEAIVMSLELEPAATPVTQISEEVAPEELERRERAAAAAELVLGQARSQFIALGVWGDVERDEERRIVDELKYPNTYQAYEAESSHDYARRYAFRAYFDWLQECERADLEEEMIRRTTLL
jgi:hypothetical protein